MEGSIQRFKEVLPVDIILQEILTRLSVDDVLRSRAVSKLWYNSTHETSFLYAHLEQSKQTPLLLLSFAGGGRDAQHFHILDDKWNPHHGFLWPRRRRFLPGGEVLPSVHGLVCFSSATRSDVHLCNPGTRECVLLPRPASMKPPFPTRRLGFGFEPSSGAYKVVSIVVEDDGEIKCEVLSTVGERAWRRVQDCPYPLGYQRSVSMEGCVYWMARSFLGAPHRIVAFHLREEVFKVVSHPKEYVGREEGWPYLGQLGGRLCLVDVGWEVPMRMEVWLLQDGGGDGRWSKQVVEMPFLAPARALPIGTWCGRYLFQMTWNLSDHLFLVDPATKVAEEAPGGVPAMKFSVSIHSQSVVPIRRKPRKLWSPCRRRRRG